MKSVIKKFKSLAKRNKFVCVQNKIDINEKKEGFFDCYVSAKTGEGFEVLKKIITKSFDLGLGEEKYYLFG